MTNKVLLILIGLISIVSNHEAEAWEHEISVGFGGGKEVDKDYYNTAYVLNAKLYKFPKIDNTLIATIDASLSNLRSDTVEHNSLYTAAVALDLRAYFLNPENNIVKPYLEISSGPVYLTQHQLGEETQGSHFAIQSTLGGGFEFGKNHGFDLNFHFAHYCNAGLASPNQGWDIPIIVSLGYQW